MKTIALTGDQNSELPKVPLTKHTVESSRAGLDPKDGDDLHRLKAWRRSTSLLFLETIVLTGDLSSNPKPRKVPLTKDSVKSSRAGVDPMEPWRFPLTKDDVRVLSNRCGSNGAMVSFD